MKGITFLLSSLTILVAYGVAPALECRARAIGAPKEELKRSAAVFTGAVIEVTKPRPDEHMEGGRVFYEERPYVYVKFRVEKSWKGVGKGQRTITVEAEREEYGCGYDFKAGTYLVYANGIGRGRARRLWTDCCTRTRRAEEAGADLRELGAGKAAGGRTKLRMTRPNSGMHQSHDTTALIYIYLAGGRAMPRVRCLPPSSSPVFKPDRPHCTVSEARLR